MRTIIYASVLAVLALPVLAQADDGSTVTSLFMETYDSASCQFSAQAGEEGAYGSITSSAELTKPWRPEDPDNTPPYDTEQELTAFSDLYQVTENNGFAFAADHKPGDVRLLMSTWQGKWNEAVFLVPTPQSADGTPVIDVSVGIMTYSGDEIDAFLYAKKDAFTMSDGSADTALIASIRGVSDLTNWLSSEAGGSYLVVSIFDPDTPKDALQITFDTDNLRRAYRASNTGLAELTANFKEGHCSDKMTSPPQ